MATIKRRRGGKRGLRWPKSPNSAASAKSPCRECCGTRARSRTTRAKKVLLAVDQIGYVPNRVAGSLASATSNLIGVVIPSLSNIVFPEVLRGINAALEESGIPGRRRRDRIRPRDRGEPRALAARLEAAAMIVAGLEHTEATHRMLARSRHSRRRTDGHRLDPDRHRGRHVASPRRLRQRGNHLLEQGYRRFGYVGHDWSADRRARLRYDGLVAALARSAASSLVDMRVATRPVVRRMAGASDAGDAARPRRRLSTSPCSPTTIWRSAACSTAWPRTSSSRSAWRCSASTDWKSARRCRCRCRRSARIAS